MTKASNHMKSDRDKKKLTEELEIEIDDYSYTIFSRVWTLIF